MPLLIKRATSMLLVLLGALNAADGLATPGGRVGGGRGRYSAPPATARGGSGRGRPGGAGSGGRRLVRGRGGGVSAVPGRGGGRGGRGGRRFESSEERDQDLFGAPGEWRARKSSRNWQEYNDRIDAEQAQSKDGGDSGYGGRAAYYGGEDLYGNDEDDDAAANSGPFVAPADFAPKTWKAEAAGGGGGSTGGTASFFAEDVASFGTLGASDELQSALAAVGASRPSHVQAAGFAPILAGNDVALADQTGSGKTIAYLAPLIQAIRNREAESGRIAENHVRALVLTPTSELAQQVLAVAKALSASGVPFRSSIITGEHKWRTQAEAAKRGLELLVCTPGRLRAHLQAENPSFSLAMTTHVVLDEADVLFEDEHFDETWTTLRSALPATAATAFVTATLPTWLVQRVQQELPLVKLLKGANLHRTAAGVQETLIDCSAGEKTRGDGSAGFNLKAAALFRELEEEVPSDRVLVFCNTISSCRQVENLLRRRDRRGDRWDVSVFHGAIGADARKRTLEDFTKPSKQGGYELPRILVCTDRASRGMDFKEVGQAILFDFPRDGIEYVRRVGRVTRGTNAPGRVTSLVLGRQLAYARALLKINREGGAVDLDTHGGMRGDDDDDA